MTVWAKRGSPIVGAAMSNCPVSEVVSECSGGAAPSTINVATSDATAANLRRSEMWGTSMRNLTRRSAAGKEHRRTAVFRWLEHPLGSAKIELRQRWEFRADARAVLDHYDSGWNGR